MMARLNCYPVPERGKRPPQCCITLVQGCFYAKRIDGYRVQRSKLEREGLIDAGPLAELLNGTIVPSHTSAFVQRGAVNGGLLRCLLP